MFIKVSAVYPNTYRGMNELQVASVIDEWFKSLEKYPVQICQRAWDKYRNTVKMKELSIALLIGIVKDLQAADRREAQKNNQRLALPTVVKGSSTAKARAECMKKCKEIFGRGFNIPENTEEIQYIYRCPKCMDTGIVTWLEDSLLMGTYCNCDFFDRQRAEYREKRGDA